MVFSPDVEKLIKRPKIEKPVEEFIIPAPADPIEPARTTPTAEEILLEQPSFVEELYTESAKLQELIDIVVETAVPFSVEVPSSDKALLGDSVNTDDYIRSVFSDTPRAHRTRKRFEWGALEQCGSNQVWPVLGLTDLDNMKKRLMNVALLAEEKLLVATVQSTGTVPPRWGQDVLDSHLREVGHSLISSASDYRLKFAKSLFTVNADMRSKLIERMVAPLISSQVRQLRSKLKELLKILKGIRFVFCHAQLLLAAEYFEVRDLLIGLIKREILETAVNMIIVALSKVQKAIISPITDFFTSELDDGNVFEEIAGDFVSEQIMCVISSALHSLASQYNDLAADVLRAVDQENRERLRKLQSLGERNVVGRWILHIDQAIALVEHALEAQQLSVAVANKLVDQILVPPPASPSKTAERVASLEQYKSLFNGQFEIRQLPFTAEQEFPVINTPLVDQQRQDIDTSEVMSPTFRGTQSYQTPINRPVHETDPSTI